jgi:cellulose synthase/poly-beta-1,6-N-acetylglucosamine synthase-like glycosyltransferase
MDRAVELPSISVVVPARDAAATLPALLESLAALDYPRDRFEVLVVDNASSDRTAGTAGRFPVRLVREEAVISSYAARNAGLRAATGDWIAFTDADCVVDRGWLRALARAAAPGVGLIAGPIRPLPGETAAQRFAAWIGALDQTRTLAHPYLPYAQTANLACAAAVFRAVGLFRPDLESGGDADLCWRVQRETGFRLVTAPEAVVFHRHRPTVRGLLAQWRRYGRGAAQLEQLHRFGDLRTASARRRPVPGFGPLPAARPRPPLTAPLYLALTRAAWTVGFRQGRRIRPGPSAPPRA